MMSGALFATAVVRWSTRERGRASASDLHDARPPVNGISAVHYGNRNRNISVSMVIVGWYTSMSNQA